MVFPNLLCKGSPAHLTEHFLPLKFCQAVHCYFWRVAAAVYYVDGHLFYSAQWRTIPLHTGTSTTRGSAELPRSTGSPRSRNRIRGSARPISAASIRLLAGTHN